MTQVAIRQSGGATIISLPKVILNTLHLQVGSTLELTLENNKIILSPINQELSLEDLLVGSPQSALRLNEEDQQWLNMPARGKEV
ncbi:MAG: AbrB/MazE/SpoVT family DNA-binding domain-containing protein [Methylococcales bacterium]|nr:MAG: AbrB/MazE/SpoVT family DNA-binding domain-containing protein [Methylococcales bacterium]